MLNDPVGFAVDIFRTIGEHPIVVIVVVLVGCFTLLRPTPGSNIGNQD